MSGEEAMSSGGWGQREKLVKDGGERWLHRLDKKMAEAVGEGRSGGMHCQIRTTLQQLRQSLQHSRIPQQDPQSIGLPSSKLLRQTQHLGQALHRLRPARRPAQARIGPPARAIYPFSRGSPPTQQSPKDPRNVRRQQTREDRSPCQKRLFRLVQQPGWANAGVEKGEQRLGCEEECRTGVEVVAE